MNMKLCTTALVALLLIQLSIADRELLGGQLKEIKEPDCKEEPRLENDYRCSYHYDSFFTKYKIYTHCNMPTIPLDANGKGPTNHDASMRAVLNPGFEHIPLLNDWAEMAGRNKYTLGCAVDNKEATLNCVADANGKDNMFTSYIRNHIQTTHYHYERFHALTFAQYKQGAACEQRSKIINLHPISVLEICNGNAIQFANQGKVDFCNKSNVTEKYSIREQIRNNFLLKDICDTCKETDKRSRQETCDRWIYNNKTYRQENGEEVLNYNDIQDENCVRTLMRDTDYSKLHNIFFREGQTDEYFYFNPYYECNRIKHASHLIVYENTPANSGKRYNTCNKIHLELSNKDKSINYDGDCVYTKPDREWVCPLDEKYE